MPTCLPTYSLRDHKKWAAKQFNDWLKANADTTDEDHMRAAMRAIIEQHLPQSNQQYGDVVTMYPDMMLEQAYATGTTLREVINAWLRARLHPECAYALMDWAEEIEASGALDNVWGGN